MKTLLVSILLALIVPSGSAHATAAGTEAAMRQWCIQDATYGTCEGPPPPPGPTSLLGVSPDVVCAKYAASRAGDPSFVYDGTFPSANPFANTSCGWHNPDSGQHPGQWSEVSKQIFWCQPPGPQQWQAGEPEPTSCPDLPFDPNKNVGCCDEQLALASNPINGGTGNKYEAQTDIQGAGALSLQLIRYYNSSPAIVRQGQGVWTLNYQRLVLAPLGAAGWVQVLRPDGRRETFLPGVGGMVADSDNAALLTQTGTGWKYVGKDDTVELYDAHGVLLSITNRAGLTDTLSYSTSTTPPSVAAQLGLLIGVADPFGEHLSFTYDSLGRLATATDNDGGIYGYSYDSHDNLTFVTYPGGSVKQYLYNEPAYSAAPGLTNLLTGIVDENGARFATFSYDGQGRAISSEHSGGASRVAFAYSVSPQQTVVTDALGTARTLSLTTILGVVKNAGLSQPCLYCGVTSSLLTYDPNGNVSSRTDFNGKKVCYSDDLSRNLELARLEGALSSEVCATVLTSPPGRADVRKITTTWNATFRLPWTITEPAPGGTKTTTFTYDTSGNLTQKSVLAPKNDGTTNMLPLQVWNWTYGLYGRVLTTTDPDGHPPTVYVYYGDSDSGGRAGKIWTITNPVGHITTFNTYDLNGRPLTITDPNLLVTTLAYHPRGWLTSRQVGTELTSYTYDGVGQVTQVTLPDSSYLHYTYDAAHRLTRISDGLGNKIVYTLDAMGNRIQEQAFDPGNDPNNPPPNNTASRTRQQVFDSLNQLHQSVGAQ